MGYPATRRSPLTESEPAAPRFGAVADVISHLLDGVHRDERHIVICEGVFLFLRQYLVFIFPVDHSVATGEYLAAFEHLSHAAPPGAVLLLIACKKRMPVAVLSRWEEPRHQRVVLVPFVRVYRNMPPAPVFAR